MPASETQIRANQANSNKQGPTGTGLVLPQIEAIEVQRRYVAFARELNPSGEVGLVFVLHAATLSVRMERCVEHETATLSDRVRRAEAEFVPPEGVDDATAARLRDEAGRRALFDSSKEATLARKYEAAAERGFFRALKELRQHEAAIKAAEAGPLDDPLGSISPGEMTDEEFDKLYAEACPPTPRKSAKAVEPAPLSTKTGRTDAPIGPETPG